MSVDSNRLNTYVPSTKVYGIEKEVVKMGWWDTGMDWLERGLTYLPSGNCFECRGMYIYFIVIILIIYIYVVAMMAFFGDDGQMKADKLNVVLIKDSPIGPIGGWPISHFIAFFIAGLLFPDCFLLAMGLGVLWEVYETVCGNLFYGDRPVCEDGSELYTGKWMQGRVEDIVFDFLGFVFGMMISLSYRDWKYGTHRIRCHTSSGDR